MDCRKAKFFLLLALFGFVSSPVDAQINLKSGYNISIASPGSFNQMLAQYNQNQSYSSSFKDLTWLHGFEAGLRFKAGLQAIELSYQDAYQSLKAITIFNGQELEDKLRFAIHSMAAGYQVSDRTFGAGTNLHYQFYRAKFTPGESGNIFKNTHNMFALKFYMMFTLRGSRGVDMSIQPYYILPFKSYDLTPLAQYLEVPPPSESDRWHRFGLSLLFYNGEK